MIRINVKDTGITVSGHAQRLPGAPPGHNIICAGVSALTLTLIEGLREVAGIEIQESVRPGSTAVSYTHLTLPTNSLV